MSISNDEASGTEASPASLARPVAATGASPDGEDPVAHQVTTSPSDGAGHATAAATVTRRPTRLREFLSGWLAARRDRPPPPPNVPRLVDYPFRRRP
jgi:hypothetical protein